MALRHGIASFAFCSPSDLVIILLLLAGSSTNLLAGQASQSEINRYSRQAEQALAAKDWDAAARALLKLAQLEPDVSEVHANLGLAYYSEGRVFEAARAFGRALELNPKMKQAKQMLGLCDAELGLDRAALTILEPAFRHPPDDQMGRLIGLDLERAYEGLQQYGKAIAVCDELLKRYPDDPEILFHTYRLYSDRSYELMRRLIRAAPDSVWVHYANAQVHESLQHYDLAIAEYRKVQRRNRDCLGSIFASGGRFCSSRETPREWMRHSTNSKRSWQSLLRTPRRNMNSEKSIGSGGNSSRHWSASRRPSKTIQNLKRSRSVSLARSSAWGDRRKRWPS